MKMPKFERLIQAVGNLQAAAGYSPKVFSRSLLVPCRQDGRVSERLFLYPQGPGSRRTRPVAWMEWEGGVLRRFALCQDADFISDCPPDTQVDYSIQASGDARDQLNRIRRLEALYASLREIPWDRPMTPEEAGIVSEYRNLLDQAVPQGLRPYYEALSPAFFAWLQGSGTWPKV